MVYGRYIHCQRFMYSPFTPHIRASHVVLTQEVLDNWGWSCHFEMKSRAYWKSLKEGHVWIMVGISNRDPYCKYFFEARKFWGFGPVLTAVWQPNFVALPSASLGSKKKTDLKKLPNFSPSDVLKPHFSQRKKPIRFLDSSPRAFKPTAPLCQGTSDTLACARKALFLLNLVRDYLQQPC